MPKGTQPESVAYSADYITSNSACLQIEQSSFGPWFAIAIELCVVGFLITVVFVDIYIAHPGSLSSQNQTLYIVGTTIIATLITTYCSRHILVLWLQATEDSESHRKINTLVGVGTFRDQLRYWHISLTWLIAGLTTTAIVAGVTPSITIVTTDMLSGLYPNDDECTLVNATRSHGWYNWELGDGTYYQLNTTRGMGVRCAPDLAFYLAGSIIPTSHSQSSVVYTIDNTAVLASAIGTPFAFEFSESLTGFGFPMGFTGSDYSPYLQSASVCFPVFDKNPVQCTSFGTVSVSGSEVSVAAGSCNISRSVFGVDPKTQGATASGACTPGKVGQAKLVIGSVNSHAPFLAAAMNESAAAPSRSHAILCEVDIAPAITYRKVTFHDLTKDQNYHEHDSVIAAGEECTPHLLPPLIDTTAWIRPDETLSTLLSNSTLAAGAAATGPLLSENAFDDGWWDTLWEIVKKKSYTYDDYKSYTKEYLTFNNSRNSLEDALGLVTAMVFAAKLGNSYSVWDVALSGGKIEASALRVGSSNTWALVYIVPEVWSVLLLGYLLWRKGRT
jgi:hypothetical protein